MPRLDNCDPSNLRVLQEWGEKKWLSVVIDLDDPGSIPPMDVCRNCYREFELTGDAEHPSYGDDDYICTLCQRRLDEDDDN